VGSLLRASLCLLLELLKDPHHDRPYIALKEKFLSIHGLTTFKTIEKFLQTEPLGDRKPTEQIAYMLEL
jgi:hypothetical protein